MAVANTFTDTGPTYYPMHGTGKPTKVDYIAVPVEKKMGIQYTVHLYLFYAFLLQENETR